MDPGLNLRVQDAVYGYGQSLNTHFQTLYGAAFIVPVSPDAHLRFKGSRMSFKSTMAVSILVLAPLAGPAFAQSAVPGTGTGSAIEKCAYIAQVAGKDATLASPALHVIGLATPDAPFELPGDAPPGVSAIQCGRTTLIPSSLDYKVLLAGFSFSIVAPDGRVLLMELSDGEVRASMLKGVLARDEVASVQAYVDKVQQFFNTPSFDGKGEK
jgi:hypothetical protein